MCRPNKNDGFTIIEVLFSILIFSIVIFGIITLAGIIVKSTKYSKDVTSATTIAQDTIEEYIRMSFVDIVAHETAVLTYNANGGIKRTYNVSVAVVATPTATSKTITVDVYWGTGGTDTVRNNVEIETILAPK